MQGSLRIFIFLLSATGFTSVGAMNSSPKQIGRCQLHGSEKLPAGAGGANAVCSEIERAVAAVSPGVRYSADVRVLSKSRLSAALVVNGHAMHEQNFVIMDGELDAGAIRRFAASVANAVAGATKASKGHAVHVD